MNIFDYLLGQSIKTIPPSHIGGYYGWADSKKPGFVYAPSNFGVTPEDEAGPIGTQGIIRDEPMAPMILTVPQSASAPVNPPAEQAMITPQQNRTIIQRASDHGLLPPIAEDLDAPLPESPDPTLTPYRIARRDPTTGELTFTTGYGRRAIAPPQQQGAVPLPDMSGAYAEAFQHLPVDQALKVVEVAMQFQGQRGYMRDVAAGLPMAQAYAKWAPMLHPRTSTGTAEAMRLTTPTPPSAYQQFQMARQTRLDQAPKLHIRQSGEIIKEGPNATYEVIREAAAKVPRMSEAKKALLKADVAKLVTIQKTLDQNPLQERAWGGLVPGNKAKRDELNKEADELRKKIASYDAETPATPTGRKIGRFNVAMVTAPEHDDSESSDDSGD